MGGWVEGGGLTALKVSVGVANSSSATAELIGRVESSSSTALLTVVYSIRDNGSAGKVGVWAAEISGRVEASGSAALKVSVAVADEISETAKTGGGVVASSSTALLGGRNGIVSG